jgi:alpha-beta hydrolase superfamily lysophospholipase
MKAPFVAGTYSLKVESGGETLLVRGHEVMDPRATLVVTPGFSDHAGRYGRLAQELGSRGYTTYVYDPRGHGKSTGRRGHTPHWSSLVEDLDRVVRSLDAAGKLGARRALLGHSMGALVALDWALSHRGEINGLALSAPFFKSAFSPPLWKRASAFAIGGFMPWLGVPTGLRGKEMSKDIVVASQYDTDPLVHGVMTPRYYFEYLAAQKRLFSAASSVDFPVFVQHGGADPVSSAEAAAQWAQAVPRPWCEWTIYQGMRHEVLNEFERGRVVSDLMYWLDRHILAHVQRGA